AIVHAIAIAVEGGAIRSGRGRSDGRSRSCRRLAEARDDREDEEPVAVAVLATNGLVVPVVTVAGFHAEVRAVGQGLGNADAEFSSRCPALGRGVVVVSTHHAS